MANLFEISAAIANEEWIDKETGEIDVAFLDHLEMTFAEKSENIIKYIKNLTAEAKALKEQEDIFNQRRKAAENKAARLKEYLSQAMNYSGLEKLDYICGKAQFKLNPPSVAIENEEQFLKWATVNAEDLLKYKAPEINKTELKDRLKAGENIPFVSLKQDKSLQIR